MLTLVVKQNVMGLQYIILFWNSAHWPSIFSLSIVFSVAYQSEKWFNYNNLSDLLKFKDLQHSSMTSKFPTRSVMPEENGCHVNEVYRMASPKLKWNSQQEATEALFVIESESNLRVKT